jgi:RNA polymerase sigma-70 factor (ECF subfamily)
MTEAQLLQRSLSGDAAAIQSIVQAYQQDIFRLALAILEDPVDAEEVMQDTFVAAFKALDTYRGSASLKTWLLSIAINDSRKKLRKRKSLGRLMRAMHSLFQMGQGPAQPEEIVIRREARTAVQKAVDTLDEKHRLPILLFYEQNLAVTEIAQALDIPIGTVLSRLHTARERLRNALADELGFLE